MAGSDKGAEADGKELMLYSEFCFSRERMLKNCDRLKIGVIGNRRKSRQR